MFLRWGSRALGLSQDLCLAFSSCTCREHRLDTWGTGARKETMKDFRDSVNATKMILTPISIDFDKLLHAK